MILEQYDRRRPSQEPNAGFGAGVHPIPEGLSGPVAIKVEISNSGPANDFGLGTCSIARWPGGGILPPGCLAPIGHDHHARRRVDLAPLGQIRRSETFYQRGASLRKHPRAKPTNSYWTFHGDRESSAVAIFGLQVRETRNLRVLHPLIAKLKIRRCHVGSPLWNFTPGRRRTSMIGLS